MNSKNKLLLIPSLILILIFPITASAKSIQRFLMECPKTMKAGEQAYCSNIRLLYTDNSTKLISRSSLSNWKTTNSALYVNGNGRLTAQRVTNDTNVTIEAEYNDNGRIKGGFSTTRVIGAGSPFTNFYISCPLRVNENTNFDCGAYATIDGRKKNVTTSTSWREKASYTTSFGYGSFSAGNVNGNSGSEIIGSYTYGSTTRSDNKMITIVDGYVPPHQKYLTKVLLKCSDSLTEGSSTQCTAIATLSDNSTINASPLINCKGTNSYASVTSSGKVTASQVTGNKNYSLECGYTYNGKTMYGIESIKIKDKNPKGFTEFRIDCPTPINENTQKQCKAYAKIDGTERNVASSSSWRENVNYASISSTGLLSAGEVSSNSGVYVVASYNYGGVKKEANQIITIKNIETPIESEPETNDKITVNITNRWKQSKITFNGNSEWIFKFISYTSGANSTSARSFSFCEKNRPEYCLNLVTGSLQSSKVSPENKKYAQWTIEDYDNYKRIRNVGYSNYYIHHEKNTIQAGYIESGWWSAQWKMEEVREEETILLAGLDSITATAVSIIESSSLTGKYPEETNCWKNSTSVKEAEFGDTVVKLFKSNTCINMYWTNVRRKNGTAIKITATIKDCNGNKPNDSDTIKSWVTNANSAMLYVNTFSCEIKGFGATTNNPWGYPAIDAGALYYLNNSDTTVDISSFPESLKEYIKKNQTIWDNNIKSYPQFQKFWTNYSHYGKHAVANYIFDFEKKVKGSWDITAVSIALYYGDNSALLVAESYTASFENLAPESLITNLNAINDNAVEATIAFNDGKITVYTLTVVISVNTGNAIVTALPINIAYGEAIQQGIEFVDFDENVAFLIETVVGSSELAQSAMNAIKNGQAGWEAYKNSNPNEALLLEAIIDVKAFLKLAKDSKSDFDTEKKNYSGGNTTTVFSKAISPEEANRKHIKNGRKPPYSNKHSVYEFTADGNMEFVRFYNPSADIGKKSSWMTRSEDVKGLTAIEIANKLALPNYRPTHMVTIKPPVGFTIRTGVAAPNFGRSGGGIQYELSGDSHLEDKYFINPRKFNILQ